MAKPPALFLHEEVLLLALRDEEGTIAPGTMYQYAIGGAVLAELLLHERVHLVKGRWGDLVEVTDPTPVGEPWLDQCLARVYEAKRRGSPQTWVSRFAGMNAKHRVAQLLCRRGILREDEDKILLIFSRRIYPEVDPVPETKLLQRLDRAVYTDEPGVPARTVVLVSLAHHAGLLKVVFDRRKLKSRKARIEQIINGEITGKATKKAIEAVQAAVMTAAIVPVIISTSS